MELSDLLEYAISMILATAILLASYPLNSWCLWGIGVGLGLRAIVTSEIAGWKSNRKPVER